MEKGELKKMVIEAFKKSDYSGSPAKTFTVMFNPNTYSQKHEVVYENREGRGDSGSPLVFSKIKPRDFTFDFLFDGTGTAAEKQEVEQLVADFLAVTGEMDGEIHRPLFLKISWGSLLTKCVLKSADITYTLFKPDGKPLRAKVKATFSENIEDARRVAQERKSSPDLTHRRVVKEGDHLSLLSDRMYGDPKYYLQIARVNGLTNYRKLTVGQHLLFPPLKDLPA